VPALRRCEDRATQLLADNPFCTKRFAFFLGRRCREGTVKAVADELHVDWHTLSDLAQVAQFLSTFARAFQEWAGV
jgi:hypothetical protein